ncbi:SH3 domain-containing protein [bacterium]|nr:SH3 domain-containing protein [bacterium]
MGRKLLILGLVVVILLAGCATVTTKEAPAKVWIKVGQANIRSAATVESKIVVTLKLGDKLRVIEKRGSWYKVRLSDKRIGWVHKSVVAPTKPRPK